MEKCILLKHAWRNIHNNELCLMESLSWRLFGDKTSPPPLMRECHHAFHLADCAASQTDSPTSLPSNIFSKAWHINQPWRWRDGVEDGPHWQRVSPVWGAVLCALTTNLSSCYCFLLGLLSTMHMWTLKSCRQHNDQYGNKCSVTSHLTEAWVGFCLKQQMT